jgi:hypothetical protein
VVVPVRLVLAAVLFATCNEVPCGTTCAVTFPDVVPVSLAADAAVVLFDDALVLLLAPWANESLAIAAKVIYDYFLDYIS